MKQKLINYFNSINGTSKTLEDIKQDTQGFTGASAKTIIEKLSDNGNGDKIGSYKTCHFVNGEKLAILKTRKCYNKNSQSIICDRIKEMLKVNSELLSAGAKLPKLYGVFFVNDRYVEMQQKILGEPIAIIREHEFFMEHDYHSFEGYNKLYEYVIDKQKLMLSLPQKAFDDLFKTYLLFKKYNYRYDDSHSENVLVNKSGFSLIDIDYNEIIASSKNKIDIPPGNTSYVYDFIHPFSYGYNFNFSDEQNENILKLNNDLLKKLLTSINKQKIDFNKNSCGNLFNLMVGSNWENIVDKTFKQVKQVELQNNLKRKK